jgi:hypothetical protein
MGIRPILNLIVIFISESIVFGLDKLQGNWVIFVFECDIYFLEQVPF